MLMLGMFAITGSPPFAPFISEFQIFSGAFAEGHPVAGIIFISCMLLVFFGMGYAVMSICFGEPTEPQVTTGFHDTIGTGLPMLVSLGIILVLGVYQPPFLERLVEEAVKVLENR